MDDPGMLRPAGAGLTRREVLRLGALAAAAALVPATTAAAPPTRSRVVPQHSPLANPYTGSIPLTFPVANGTYGKPFRDNWHDNREGPGYDWSHQNGVGANGAVQRAHDGVDIFPRFSTQLPPVFAPFRAWVAAVNVAGAPTPYRQSIHKAIQPPWPYPPATAGDNIYGNYIWLYSLAPDSPGYFMLYCHLQSEATLIALAGKLDAANTVGDYVEIGTATQVGLMGESGNATGQPQLHLELHYPRKTTSPDYELQSFVCTRCAPTKSPMTAFNPFPSLSKATARP